jgi:hypothetical protein
VLGRTHATETALNAAPAPNYPTTLTLDDGAGDDLLVGGDRNDTLFGRDGTAS